MLKKPQENEMQRMSREAYIDGFIIGEAEGKIKALAEAAKRMIRAGFTNSQILKITELDLATVEAFRKKLRRPEPADKA